MNKKFVFPFLALIIFLFMAKGFGQSAIDHSDYNQLLKTYVDHQGGVNYLDLKKDGLKTLDQYLKKLNKVNLISLSKNEKKALYINAYNAFTLKLIAKHYPVTSIKKIPDISGLFGTGQWNSKDWKIGNQIISLNEIEHKILRPLGDPRIHFALVCASLSCPNLSQDAYEANDLNRQLDQQAQLFNQSKKGVQQEIVNGKPVLKVSSIYKWFKEDFLKVSSDLPSYIEKYTSSSVKSFINKNRKNLKIEYLDYNWGLNDIKSK